MITMLKKDMTNKEETELESDIIRQNRLDEALDRNAKFAEEICKLNDEKENAYNFINLLLLSKLEGIPTNGINNVFNQIRLPYKAGLQKI